jgi:hypothetical protein
MMAANTKLSPPSSGKLREKMRRRVAHDAKDIVIKINQYQISN